MALTIFVTFEWNFVVTNVARTLFTNILISNVSQNMASTIVFTSHTVIFQNNHALIVCLYPGPLSCRHIAYLIDIIRPLPSRQKSFSRACPARRGKASRSPISRTIYQWACRAAAPSRALQHAHQCWLNVKRTSLFSLVTLCRGQKQHTVFLLNLCVNWSVLCIIILSEGGGCFRKTDWIENINAHSIWRTSKCLLPSVGSTGQWGRDQRRRRVVWHLSWGALRVVPLRPVLPVRGVRDGTMAAPSPTPSASPCCQGHGQTTLLIHRSHSHGDPKRTRQKNNPQRDLPVHHGKVSILPGKQAGMAELHKTQLEP